MPRPGSRSHGEIKGVWNEIYPAVFFTLRRHNIRRRRRCQRQSDGAVTLQSKGIKLDSIHWGFKVKIYLMFFPGESFSFLCSLQGAHTFIFPPTLSLHISFNPPADTGAHLPEALRSLHCGHQSCQTQLRGFFFFFTSSFPLPSTRSPHPRKLSFQSGTRRKGKNLALCFHIYHILLITERPTHRHAGHVVILSPAAHGRQ